LRTSVFVCAQHRWTCGNGAISRADARSISVDSAGRQCENAAHAQDHEAGPELKKRCGVYKHLFAAKLWAYYPRR
jgi:hypothetical protein